jgi:hypothetical protein
MDILKCIIEQNNRLNKPTQLMTDNSAPDDCSLALDMDSLFESPSLHSTYSSESTASDNSLVSSDDFTIETCSSTSTEDCTHLGKPPPGSLMEWWDKQFPTSMIHPFPTLFQDGQVTVDVDLDTCDPTDNETCDSSIASIEITQHGTPIL